MKYKLITKNQKAKKYRDIRHIAEWPNSVLVERYDQAKEKAIEVEKQLEKCGLYEQKKRKVLAKKYRTVLRLIELLEDKGRECEILYFMPWKEVKDLCDREFNNKRKFKLVSKRGGYTHKRSL
jgi:hypothetical protein